MAKLIDNQEQTLEQALKNTLPYVESIDILTAYFYFSGFSMLADELKDKKIRILIGKTIDPNAVDNLSAAIKMVPTISLDGFQNQKMYALTRTQKRKEYTDSFIKLFNKSSLSESFDSTDSQKMFLIFEEKLRNGTLEIRMTSEDNHAKTYILTNKLRFSANGDAKGVVFMGSSNFTYSGLIGQGELNDRFSDNQTYEKYLIYFEKLWKDSNSIDIKTSDSNNDFLKEIEKRLWIHSTPAPYKIFIRILHELYKQIENEDIKTPDTISGGKFVNLRYQIDAIKSGIDCINKNNGVIIADVVGLGKSIIASAIANNLDIQRCIIVSPPHLIQQWKDYIMDFGIKGAIVESGGKIDNLHNKYASSDNPILFIIDEAHRYRNELTEDYQLLHQLTRSHSDNKVILLTATPYNNRPQDLFAMVKLFQTPSRSTIHSVDNLSLRFRELISEYRKLERKGKKEMTDKIREDLQKLSQELRILIEPIIIRRSRIDLKQIKEYADDLKNQKISFPEVVGPDLIEYDLGEIRELYISTLIKLTDTYNGFTGARYMSTTYLKNRDEFISKYEKFFDETDLQTAQRNLAQFMKRLLVMRFESSKYAFESTLKKILQSNRTILKWWERGYVPILKKGELLGPDDFDLDDLLEQIERSDEEDVDVDKIKRIAVPIPKDMIDNKFIHDVKHDIKLLSDIYKSWFTDGEIGYDPKQKCIEKKIAELLAENTKRKIVIFSSFADTAEWVAKNLKEHGFYRTLLYTGSSANTDRQVVTDNFDASIPEAKQKNDYDIIIATDALSEGFNLHRAGVVINYDIPYNPTRVVQRIGRINRINKRVFDKIFIMNFFPTDIGASITNIKGIATLKMLLINNIIGSDTKTLTPDEDLQSYFKKQYSDANELSDDASWDNEFRNIYNSIKHDMNLLKEILEIPERTRIVRNNQKNNVSISFAKRGNGVLFALAKEHEKKASIATPEIVLNYFKAAQEEESLPGDAKLDSKFEILRKKIMEKHPLPKIEGRRADALKKIEFLKENYRAERDYLLDLYEAIKTFDDLSDGELKFIAQLEIDVENLKNSIDKLIEKFPIHYIGVIKERAETVDRVTEVIMFTEDLRK
ncbi:helicase-related protein [Sedimentibacter sp.]|uniref:helicase-related protein n=1 Tax=Sedimentibacter sp. TaxID=1960295 RepID=UPI0028A7C7D4|nr:helicase-related protein [Sedimentibacter sp.]